MANNVSRICLGRTSDLKCSLAVVSRWLPCERIEKMLPESFEREDRYGKRSAEADLVGESNELIPGKVIRVVRSRRGTPSSNRLNQSRASD